MEVNLGAINYANYQSWEMLTAPSGAVYYVVPGTAYVYDPFLSQQKGRAVLWQNPKATWEEKARTEKMIENANSPTGQVAAVAGPVLGTVGANYAINALGPTSAATQGGAQLAAQGGTQLAAQAGAQGGSAALAAPEILGVTRGTAELAAGNTTNASATSAGEGLGTAVGIATTAKGAYDTQRGWESGGEGLRSGLTTMGAGAGGLIAGPLGAAAGGLIGNVLGYGLQGSGWKNHAALVATAPILAGLKLSGVNLVHQTTRQLQQEHTQKLLESAPTNEAWANYVKSMRYQEANKDMPFAGKYKTFEEYKKAGLQADDLTGVYGNLNAFGAGTTRDWLTLTFQEKKAVTQGLIDAGLYDSTKGEVIITDPIKANDVFDKALGRAAPTTSSGAFADGAGLPTPQDKQSLIGRIEPPQNLIGRVAPAPIVMEQPMRSKTLSPGVGLDGQRLETERLGKLLAKRLKK